MSKNYAIILLSAVLGLAACSKAANLDLTTQRPIPRPASSVTSLTDSTPSPIPALEAVLGPAVLNSKTVEFRDFIPGQSTYDEIKAKLEKNKTDYPETDFPNAFTIRTVTSISSNTAVVNFYFDDKVLAIVDVLIDFDDFQTQFDIEEFLTAKYGRRQIDGFYRYPNIQRDFILYCSYWGEKKNSSDPCIDAPIIQEDDSSEVSRKLQVGFIKNFEYSSSVESFLYQTPLLADRFRKKQYAIKEEQDKIKQDQDKKDILDKFKGEL